MRSFVVRPAGGLRGEVVLPGDKSIAHRALIVSAITPGITIIRNFPANEDCFSTVDVFKKLGIKIFISGYPPILTLEVFGQGLRDLQRPKGPLFVGDSGTTLRLLLGILAGQDFKVKLTCGRSLSHRPMRRVTLPLRMMGARVWGRREKGNKEDEEYPPITMKGGALRSIRYTMPVASAQVKSALLLASLFTNGRTRITEPLKTRDHTERMLRLFGADISVKGNQIVISGNKGLVSPGEMHVPGDVSSASFFMVAAAIVPRSRLVIKSVSLNPSRIGVIRVLKRMGARIKIQRSKSLPAGQAGRNQYFEPTGNVTVSASNLKGTTVEKSEVPSLIDELPILMVAASVARGKTTFRGIGELRVKETDRIEAMLQNLRRMGAKITVGTRQASEWIVIEGAKTLKGAKVRSFGDHRTAMSMAVAGLRGKGATVIDDFSCVRKSFPQFLEILKPLIKKPAS